VCVGDALYGQDPYIPDATHTDNTHTGVERGSGSGGSGGGGGNLGVNRCISADSTVSTGKNTQVVIMPTINQPEIMTEMPDIMQEMPNNADVVVDFAILEGVVCVWYVCGCGMCGGCVVFVVCVWVWYVCTNVCVLMYVY
jgi:hypothetical protein